MNLNTLKFQYPWRAYQARVLENLPLYREDQRIHIVAPPGAGKTVLGLEIVRQLGKKSLILAPSLTIRAQWGQRFRDDFCADQSLISHKLEEPAELTIVTYQAVFEYFKRNGTAGLDWVELLVVDECHHLRNEWWKVLDALRNDFKPELVALTATPPYDVSGIEWRRYHEFCGEIDEEISIPELVASGDLCPHQDYLYPVLPPPGESKVITEWQSKKDRLLEEMHVRSGLALYLQDHPWLADPESHYTEIFERPEYFTSLLSVLRAQGSEPPAAALGVLHGEVTLAPELDDNWATIFLQRALREDPYFATEDGKALLRPYRRIITTMGAWSQGKLYLDHDLPPGSKKTDAELESPRAKLDALVEIAKFESEDLGGKLRMVMLTDHIHHELLPTTEHDRTPLNLVGTVPVFETLRRQTGTLYEGDLCILTGSLVVIPKAAESRLLEIAYDELPTERVIKTTPLFPGSKYVKVNTGGLANKYSVGWITQLFTEGKIRIIVGTKSLLGEGWDAPVINSLVLANSVGSFVLSNQMRGRAIRTVRGEPDKTANIWHPVVVHPGIRRGGPDVRRMRRRFKAFAGPRLDDKPVIQNGIGRFGIDWDKSSTQAMELVRKQILHAATKREDLIAAWKKALSTGTQLVEAIKPPTPRHYEQKDPLTLHYKESIDRYFEQDYRLFLLEIKRATLVAFAAGAITTLLPGSWFNWTTPTTALMCLMMAVAFLSLSYVYRRFKAMYDRAGELQLAERHEEIYARELNIPPYLIYPALLSILPALFNPLAFAVFWLVGLGWLAWYLFRNPGRQMADATRRFELLADTRHRLMTYGKALAESLAAAGLFHKATPDQLRLEEEGEEMFLYLSEAEHHDTHLFAGALAELMSPVENPRYLLRLDLPDDWTKGEYFLSVPSALGNKKMTADLAGRLSEVVDHDFESIYTREPAGRLHLLTARLQASGKVEEVAERDMLWR
ncbi:DEAD/DEAH box helicase family protein [Neolewinella agarilytica]|uniref:DEAD/DEAH box helicase family protein n=1 Tax=Neolewinella agarilytica TaxID=478744 RepID=UPI0023575D02|nr:DEAD/DEAH box helicase family protein [Neolewinella agarilytica]